MTHPQFLSGLLLAISLDQLSKYWAAQSGVTSINHGISFGLLNQSQLGLVVLLVGILLVIWYLCQDFWKKYPLFAGLLFGGGISNIIDRIFFSGVRDWLTLPGLHLKNNLADWAIFIAIVSILYLELAQHMDEQEKRKHA